ncbi:MAG: DNA internalization-related competence protein ComEC/Rec2 [Thermodesulfovibrionales bacterium]|nr:DNA internalization-related competence protein ComEC/Rec2 [Thermodesulfovibrionales bacterium]
MNIKDKALMSLKNSIVITLSATIGTAPLTAYYFNYFSIVSPFTNLLITPFIGFVILPIAILSSMFYVFTDWFAMNSILSIITEMMLSSVRYLSQFKYADVKVSDFPIVFIFLSVISILISSLMVSCKLHERSKMFSINILALFIFPLLLIIAFKSIYTNKGELMITFLDVGQGDSAVVELPDKKVIVIDTGKNSFNTSRYLRYRGIKEVDALVVSHPQRDHVGGIERLIKEFKIKEIWDNGFVSYSESLVSGIYHQRLQRGDKTEGIDYKILVIHPHSNFKPEKNVENNLSLVLKIETKNNSFLFTGDIELEAIDDMLHLGNTLNSTVIKIPHHGSRASISEDFIRVVSPKIAILSVGRKNFYNFPHKETLNLLQGISVFRTDEKGAIRIKESRTGTISVLTARDFKIKKVTSFFDEWLNIKRLFMVWFY